MQKTRVLFRPLDPKAVLMILPKKGVMMKLGAITKLVGRSKPAVKRALDSLVSDGYCKAASNGHGERIWKRM